MGRATDAQPEAVDYVTHFNPRPPWGGRRYHAPTEFASFVISIHALRGEGDLPMRQYVIIALKISIHALRGEGDENYQDVSATTTISIHALRGEGDSWSLSNVRVEYRISIHALRGEGDYYLRRRPRRLPLISIHALRGEGDHNMYYRLTYLQ